MLSTMSLVYPGMALIGAIYYYKINKFKFSKQTFSDPLFYIHWSLLVANCIFVYIGICLVSKENLPLVILINYLWPTAIILASIFLKTMHVQKKFQFTCGLIVIITCLTYELAGKIIFNQQDLFDHNSTIAYFATFIGAITWGIYSVLSRKFNTRLIGGPALPIYQSFFLILLPFSFYSGTLLNLSIPDYALVILFCLIQGGGFISWEYGMRYGNVLILSLLADFIPLLSLIFTNLIHDIPLSLGTLLIFIGMITGALLTRFSTSSSD